MVTLDESWNGRLRRIGDLEHPDHCHLGRHHDCYFFGEYTARAGYGHSSTNQLISNLKKSPATRNTYQWRHKQRAIGDVAGAIRENFHPDRLPDVTFVPIPPSKPVGHPEYDDRMTQVARSIGPGVDVRELLVTLEAREARHLNNDARDRQLLRQSLGINDNLLNPMPREIFILDDVLTTGCSFSVCAEILQELFPGVSISGLFVARRVLPPMFPPLEDFEL